MSLTRKASSTAKKAIKPPRQDLAAALAERETELAEARRQQAATAEILRVISRSPADAGPVFEAILEACQRLFGSDEIGVYTIADDDMVRVAAWRGPRAEEVRRDVTPVAESVTGRVIPGNAAPIISPIYEPSPIYLRPSASGSSASAAHRSSMRRCYGRIAE